MKKNRIRRGAAIILALLVAINSVSGRGVLSGIVSFADVERQAVVNATTLNVRSGAGTDFSVVDKLTNGAAVAILGEENGSDGMVWYQIRFSGSTGTEMTGYVRSDYIRFPTAYTSDMDFEAYLVSQGFPESYKTGLRQLHALYPNWVFTAQHTNLDWNTVIENESLVGRNLVYNGSISSWKSTADGAYNWETSTWPSFDSGSYVAASSALIAYYMDPRNFMDDKYVFQFLLHSYDASSHTEEGLRSMVEGTFLSGSAAVSGGYGTSSGAQDPSAGSGGSGASLEGPAGAGGGSGTGTQGPSAGSSGSGASLQGPASTSGGSGTGAQGPSAGSGGSGASLEGPASTSSGSGASLEGPGSASGSEASLEEPGMAVSSAGGSGSSRILGSVRLLTGNHHLLMTLSPGLTTGPGSGTAGSGSSSRSGSSGPADEAAQAASPSPPAPSSDSAESAGSASQTVDYVRILMDAGVQSGVNPYVLASMLIQEQGTDGTGDSISGCVSGYEGYYNYFNIEAYRSEDMEATTRGLWYASQSGSYGRPWDSADKSIAGGALYYGTNYVKVGQDTFYLKKFNVQGDNLYKHQYMTNVQAAASEGARLSEAYGEQLKQVSKLEFKIPVYLNMPDLACAKPTVDGSPNNKLSSLGVEGFAITPTFNRDTESYDLIVNSSVSEVNVSASAYSDSAVISGTGTVSLQSGTNEIRISVKAQNGDERVYVIRVVKQQNGPSYDGSITPETGGSAYPGGSSGSDGAQSGPSGSPSDPVSSEGPGSAGSGYSPGAGGPGGSNVTIVP